MAEGFMAEYSDNPPKETTKTEPKEEPEVIPEVTPEPPEEPPQEEPKELSKQEKIEAKARDGGWVPLEEWSGNPEEWVSAEVFNARGPLFEKIKYSNDKVDRLETQIKSLIELNKKAREDERKKVLSELQSKKIQLMQDGDYEGVVKVENEIEKKKSEKEPEEKNELTPEQQQVKEKMESWISNNQWWNKEVKMRAYGDAMGQDYMAKHPEASIDDILDYTVKEVRSQFPEYFGDAAPQKSPVGSGGNQPVKKKDREVTVRDLDDFHRELLNGIIEADTTGRSKEQITKETIRDWKDIGEI